ncbi:serine/threonine-protein phosphatase 6 regulatory ankyrin repeat subunit A-like [Watersipora subatra]|uniref:serine/threonine-protein phosphatase 6 regulatory ankyrin repeat subunit A-like n=1 Tax=Watersipora subatra TaxID=2589382 RepID=UPI00355B2EE4
MTKLYLEQLDSHEQRSLLNLKCACGSTPLQRAANNGHHELIAYLVSILSTEEVEHQLMAQNGRNDTALHRASWNGHLSTIDILLSSIEIEKRKDLLFIKNEEGNTSLHELAVNNHSECLQHILKSIEYSGWLAVLNICNCDCLMPFHLAVQNGNGQAMTVIFQSLQTPFLTKVFIMLHKLFKDNQRINQQIRSYLPMMWPDDSKFSKMLDRYFEKDSPTTVKSLLDDLTDCNSHAGRDNIDVLGLTNQREETILHIASKANHVQLVTKLLHDSDETSLNTALLKNTSHGQNPISLTTCKQVKSLLAWSETQEGFYFLKLPPKLVIVCTSSDHPEDANERTCIHLTMTKLCLQPVILANATERELMELLTAGAQEDTSALIVTITCRGNSGVIQLQDKTVAVSGIINCMNSSNMAGKPKVLILQICQRTGITNTSDGVSLQKQLDLPSLHYSIPGHDFLVITTIVRNDSAERNLMISTLFHHLQNSVAGDDIHDIFLRVKGQLAETNQEQFMEYRSTLNKKLCLRPLFYSKAKHKNAPKRNSRLQRLFSREKKDGVTF